MSVYCRIAAPTVFMRALHTVAISRDGWATVVFTDSHVVLHVEGIDENMTATCTLPKSLFAEYAVVETRFSLHIPTLMDALLMLGPTVLAASTRTVLAFPTEDAKLLVELTPSDRLLSSYGYTGRTAGAESDVGFGQRILQSLLVTRNVREHVLDLRFAEATLLAQVTLQGDTLRDIITDLNAAQCTEVALRVDPKDGVLLHGTGGPYGDVSAHIEANSDVIFSLSREQSGETRVYTHHLALACGVRGSGSGGGGGSGSGGSSGAGRSRATANNTGGMGSGGGFSSRDGRLSNADYLLMGLAASGTGGASTLFGGFERLTLQINAQRQLSVLHTQREHEQKVAVTVVVMPLCSVYDIL
jgi:cell cycle checkpoint protein